MEQRNKTMNKKDDDFWKQAAWELIKVLDIAYGSIFIGLIVIGIICKIFGYL